MSLCRLACYNYRRVGIRALKWGDRMSRVIFYLPIVILGIAAVLMAGCTSQHNPTPNLEINDNTLKSMVPSIDTSMPTKAETATFALG